MKKIFNHATTLIVATLLTLTACLSGSPYDPVPPIDGEGTSVSLRFNTTEFETRNVGGQFEDIGVPVTFNTGHLYLVSPSGTIIEHFAIVNDGSGTINVNREVTNDRINHSDLTHPGGVTIVNVPPSLRGGRAVIVGNTAITANVTHISAVKATEIDIRYQTNTLAPHLFGYDALTRRAGAIAPNGNYIYEALVPLTPTIARLEIPNIVGMGAIQSFVVEGVFIDNYHRRARVDGTPVPASRRNNVLDAREFNLNTSGYPTAFHRRTFDWYREHLPFPSLWASNPSLTPIIINGNNLGTRPVVTPASTGVSGTNIRWYYHLFAGVGTNTPTPRVVFRLRDIVRSDGVPVIGSRFVVFNEFFLHNPGNVGDGAPLPYIEPGLSYRIQENRLVFSEHDLLTTIPTTLSTLSTRATPIEIIE